MSNYTSGIQRLAAKPVDARPPRRNVPVVFVVRMVECAVVVAPAMAIAAIH